MSLGTIHQAPPNALKTAKIFSLFYPASGPIGPYGAAHGPTSAADRSTGQTTRRGSGLDDQRNEKAR